MAGVAKLQLLINLRNDLRSGLDRARRQVNQAVGGMQNRLNSFRANIASGLSSIGEQIPMVGGAIGMLANPFALVTTAATLSIGAITASTMAANDWHTQMAEINVTAELSRDKLALLSDQLLEVGGRNIAPLEDVPKAFNKIISAGLSVKDSLATLEPTLRAAKAGFTDIEIVAESATNVMMSTGLSANRVFDVLFTTVKDGNASFKDIAQYLPKVIPIAQNVGYELEQVTSAFAVLTGRMSAEQSTTSLQGIMRALSAQRVAIGQIDKATGQYVSGFKSIGIDVFDPATKKIKPILDIAKELNRAMAGLSDEARMVKFDQIGLDQSAASGLASLMQNIPTLEQATVSMRNSQGALNKAYEDAKTPLDNWRIIQNKIKVEMIHIGEYFLPILSKIGQSILDTIQYWKDLYNESILFRDTLRVLSWLSERLFDVFTYGIRPIITFVQELNGWFSQIGDKISNATGNVSLFKGSFTDMYESIRPYLVAIKDILVEIGGLMLDIYTFDINGVVDRIKNFKMPDVVFSAHSKAQREKGDFAGVRRFKDAADTDTDVNTNTNNNNSSIADGVKGIKGGSQSKNITINIDSFIKNLSSTNQAINSMSIDEIEKKMTEVFMRVVRSAETM